MTVPSWCRVSSGARRCKAVANEPPRLPGQAHTPIPDRRMRRLLRRQLGWLGAASRGNARAPSADQRIADPREERRRVAAKRLGQKCKRLCFDNESSLYERPYHYWAADDIEGTGLIWRRSRRSVFVVASSTTRQAMLTTHSKGSVSTLRSIEGCAARPRPRSQRPVLSDPPPSARPL